MDNASRLADAMRRPGMYGIATMDQALIFLGGFDAATEFTFLAGFREWLAARGAGGANRTWTSLAAALVEQRRAEIGQTEEQCLRDLFRIVQEFLDEQRRKWQDPAPGEFRSVSAD